MSSDEIPVCWATCCKEWLGIITLRIFPLVSLSSSTLEPARREDIHTGVHYSEWRKHSVAQLIFKCICRAEQVALRADDGMSCHVCSIKYHIMSYEEWVRYPAHLDASYDKIQHSEAKRGKVYYLLCRHCLVCWPASTSPQK